MLGKENIRDGQKDVELYILAYNKRTNVHGRVYTCERGYKADMYTSQYISRASRGNFAPSYTPIHHITHDRCNTITAFNTCTHISINNYTHNSEYDDVYNLDYVMSG